MNWIPLTAIEQLELIKKNSEEKPQVIYKHSTRCSISSTAMNRLERNKDYPDADFYYLDLIAYRNVSNAVSETFGLEHESPQILVIKNGTLTYDADHMGITADDLIDAL